jgi:hypothetical protein
MTNPRWLAIPGVIAGLAVAGCVSAPTQAASTASASPVVSASSSATPAVITVVPSPASKTPSKATVILDAPEMVFSRPEDQLHAPETFVIDGDTLTIADRVHKLLVTYHNGQRTGTIPFPDMNIQDMAIRGDHYYFLDPDQIHVAEYLLGADRLLQRTATWSLPAEAWLIKWDGQYLAAHLVERNTWVSATGSDPITANPTFGLEGHTFEIFDGPLTMKIPTRWEPIGIDLVDREGDYSYYKVTDNYTRANATQVYISYIYQFDNQGHFIHSYTMRIAKVYKPAREIQIDNGQVYQLYETEKTAQILRLAPNP